MSADFTANTGANNFTYTAPTNVTASCAIGNGLLVAIGVPIASDPITVTDPDNAGNVFTAATSQPFQDTANGWELVVFWLPNASATLTRFKVTEGGGGNNFCAAWGEISGQNTSTFIDVQNGIGGTTWTSNPVTTTVTADLVAAMATNSGANTLSNSGGFTNVATLSTTRTMYLAKRVNQATGTYNPNWSGGSTGGASFTVGIESAPTGVVLGAIPLPGPGVSPSLRNQFLVPRRDSSSPSNALLGFSTSVSTVFGSVVAAGSLAGGQSYSASTDFGQATGAGALPGNSYSVSVAFGTLSQSPVLMGYIPKGGPGISPSSFFQFSTPILDSTLNLALTTGYSYSYSTVFGQTVGTGALSGNSYSVSTVFHTSINGVLTGVSTSVSTIFAQLGLTLAFNGVSYSASTSFGALTSLALTQITGQSYSVSTAFGGITALTLSQIIGSSYSVTTDFGFLIGTGPPGRLRVKAMAPGDYNGIFRNIGDVFDINVPDYSPWNVSIVPIGNPNYPLFGWMMAVASTTPLFDYSLANQGASSPVVATKGINTAGQVVYGDVPNVLGDDDVE